MTDTLLLPPLGHHLLPPWSQPMTVQMDLRLFGFLHFTPILLCPQESPVPSLRSPWSPPMNTDTFCRGFPDVMTTHRLLLIARLHFPNCYLCFHPSNFHSNCFKMTDTYTMWTKLGAVSFHHLFLLH